MGVKTSNKTLFKGVRKEKWSKRQRGREAQSPVPHFRYLRRKCLPRRQWAWSYTPHLTVLILDRESRANRLLCIFKKAISAVADLIADGLERGPELVLVLFGA